MYLDMYIYRYTYRHICIHIISFTQESSVGLLGRGRERCRRRRLLSAESPHGGLKGYSSQALLSRTPKSNPSSQGSLFKGIQGMLSLVWTVL